MGEDGVKACERAFLRLKAGKPNIPAHVGLEPSKVTAGIVSVEAGFDRGYLKKSRVKHLHLLAEIESYRSSKADNKSSLGTKYRRATSKIQLLESELKACNEIMYTVLTQNLQLVETVRRLERFIKRCESGNGKTSFL